MKLTICTLCGCVVGPQINHTWWHNNRGETPGYADVPTDTTGAGA